MRDSPTKIKFMPLGIGQFVKVRGMNLTGMIMITDLMHISGPKFKCRKKGKLLIPVTLKIISHLLDFRQKSF